MHMGGLSGRGHGGHGNTSAAAFISLLLALNSTVELTSSAAAPPAAAATIRRRTRSVRTRTCAEDDDAMCEELQRASIVNMCHLTTFGAPQVGSQRARALCPHMCRLCASTDLTCSMSSTIAETSLLEPCARPWAWADRVCWPLCTTLWAATGPRLDYTARCANVTFDDGMDKCTIPTTAVASFAIRCPRSCFKYFPNKAGTPVPPPTKADTPVPSTINVGTAQPGMSTKHGNTASAATAATTAHSTKTYAQLPYDGRCRDSSLTYPDYYQTQLLGGTLTWCKEACNVLEGCVAISFEVIADRGECLVYGKNVTKASMPKEWILSPGNSEDDNITQTTQTYGHLSHSWASHCYVQKVVWPDATTSTTSFNATLMKTQATTTSTTTTSMTLVKPPQGKQRHGVLLLVCWHVYIFISYVSADLYISGMAMWRYGHTRARSLSLSLSRTPLPISPLPLTYRC